MEFIHSKNDVKVFGENGEVIAEVTFPEIRENTVEANHTFVADVLRGQGVAGKLMEEMVKNLQENGNKVVLTCSYAVKWFEKNPQYSDLLEK